MVRETRPRKIRCTYFFSFSVNLVPKAFLKSGKISLGADLPPLRKNEARGVCTQVTLKQQRPIAKFKVFTLLYYLKGLEQWCLKAVTTNSSEIPCGTTELAWDSVPATHLKRS